MGLRGYRETARGKRLPGYLRSGSELDLKIEAAARMLRSCALCERRCAADRASGETGFCGVGADSFYFLEAALWGEESPLNPSHEIFFSGCNMRCKFCYAWDAVADPSRGKRVVPAELARLIDRRRLEGAANVNLIGGEPTVHLPNILKVIRLLQQPTPIVWNSNFYMSEESMLLLDGVVDLYVGDFRFGNDRCARELAQTDRYFETAARNLIMAGRGAGMDIPAHRQAGAGMNIPAHRDAHRSGLIIRHLLLPGHIDCCLRPIADWVARSVPNVPFNLMFQYTPFFGALDDPSLCRSLTRAEEKEARRIVTSLGLNAWRWKRPLCRRPGARRSPDEDISTTIIVRPDGRVGILHLHGELMEVVRALRRC